LTTPRKPGTDRQCHFCGVARANRQAIRRHLADCEEYQLVKATPGYQASEVAPVFICTACHEDPAEFWEDIEAAGEECECGAVGQWLKVGVRVVKRAVVPRR
jgi:hypothetical protein